MENLVALATRIHQVSPLPVFAKETFVVQNQGMQHWLNMSLAEELGVSFNIDYRLPAQFLWKLLRTISAGGEQLEQDPFSREALSWRIHSLLKQDKITNDPIFDQVTDYWQQSQESQRALKRFQLAKQLADLYEQYLVFRPDWIHDWHSGDNKFIAELNGQDADVAKWQMRLWQYLVEEQSYDPQRLIENAVSLLPQFAHALPKRISFFGINSLAPMWLNFIHELSEHTQVHFFHLNPCADYWGDIQTEKQAMAQLSKWSSGDDFETGHIGNPLLANLGQQGREFLSLLQQYSTIDVEAFSEELNAKESELSTLHYIQQDILHLEDRRIAPIETKDDSIVITSAHSALREIQGLHDWLLHQFNQDSELTPKDVLVMCPQVEDYAPYINSVFIRGWQGLDSNIPPLPCSISDRISKDADPLVNAFSELLSLPDSRFEVSKIIGWLQIPLVQNKFSFDVNDLSKIILWLEKAAVHWGLNSDHKNQLLTSKEQTALFTWQHGFERLMRGFAYGEHQVFYQDALLLPDVEGSEAETLGKLMLFIEQLQWYSLELQQQRSAIGWHQFLNDMVTTLYDTEQGDVTTITSGIEQLVEFTEHAQYSEQIELEVVRDFLLHHFSQPEPGRQFMIGQVTFCSMLPMRSIPFKIIAILGLNDGDYPRTRLAFNFDLMSASPARVGDRSRRGDDRYLFLEAILSARKHLYLSYQGKNIRNNKDKQPSVVLNELLEYLNLGFGWRCFANDRSDIRQLPMQAFSRQNYATDLASFDTKWLALSNLYINEAQDSQTYAMLGSLEVIPDEKLDICVETTAQDTAREVELDLATLVSFFQHPSRAFGKNTLSLHLNVQEHTLTDSEPFASDMGDVYFFKEKLIQSYITANDTPLEDVDQVLKRDALYGGRFPVLPNTDLELEKLVKDSRVFYDYMLEQGLSTKTLSSNTNIHQVNISTSQGKLIQCKCYIPIQQTDSGLVHYRSTRPKARDFLTMYVQMLSHQLANSELNSFDSCYGFFFDSKKQQVVHYRLGRIPEPDRALEKLVSIYLKGQGEPLLLNADFALKIKSAKRFDEADWLKQWHDCQFDYSVGNDPYLHYFWPECPDFEESRQLLADMYQDIFSLFEEVTVS